MLVADFAALLSDSGQVFTWGSAAQGRLGHRNKVASTGPRRVFGAIANRRCIDIAVGSGFDISCLFRLVFDAFFSTHSCGG
jgi:alpha-tubulin suppressor-like RCC1 family protein